MEAMKTERYYLIKTWGCQMNFHDSERFSGILEGMGFKPCSDEERADVIILNTCSVRAKSAAKAFTFLGRLKKLKEKDPRKIVGFCGCVAQQEKEEIFRRFPYVDLVIGPRRSHDLARIINKALEGKGHVRETSLGDRKVFERFDKPKRNTYPKAYITIMEGCDRFCSYCIVPYARGREIFKPAGTIMKEVELSLDEEYREIVLLGQNVNNYRWEDLTFAKLLERIVEENDALNRLRFITSHPAFVTEELLDVMAHPALCNHLHLPVQSGSDRVLERMNRGYSRREYLEWIRRFKERLKGIEFATDIIVGFPGEGERDFEDTISLLEMVRFNSIFSFKYSPRPLTRASKLRETVSEHVKMNRLERVHRVQEKIQRENHARMIGTTVRVLVDGVSQKRKDEVTGRTKENFIVNFPGDDSSIGEEVSVKITAAHTHSIRGERD